MNLRAPSVSIEPFTISFHSVPKVHVVAPEVGVIGWCFGGTWSIRAAAEMPESLDAGVIY